MIKIYTKPFCKQCEFTVRYLKDKGIKFEEIYLFNDVEALVMLRDEGYTQMPVVEIEGQEPHTGFRPDILAKLAVK